MRETLKAEVVAIALKTLQGWLEQFIYFPLLFACALLFQPYLPVGLFLALTALSVPLALALRAAWKPKNVLMRLAVAAAVGGAAAFLLFPLWLPCIAAALIGSFIFYRELRRYALDWPRFFPDAMIIAGMAQLFVAAIVYAFVPLMRPYHALINGLGAAAFIICVLFMNRREIAHASLSGNRNSAVRPDIFRKNAGFTALFLIAAAVAASHAQLGRILRWIVAGVGHVLLFVTALLQTAPSRDAPREIAPPTLPPAQGAGKESLLMQIISIVAMAAAGAAMLFLLVKLARAIRPLVLRFLHFLKAKLASREEDASYTDEKISLLRKENKRKSRSPARPRLLRRGKMRELWRDAATTREKIRFLYKELILHAIANGFHHKESFTPHVAVRKLVEENLADPARDGNMLGELADLYDQARYGPHQMDDINADAIRNRLQQNRLI
ncbi:MAG TPA: DUF4129 domain-containing protein [Bacilli bacterium]